MRKIKTLNHVCVKGKVLLILVLISLCASFSYSETKKTNEETGGADKIVVNLFRHERIQDARYKEFSQGAWDSVIYKAPNIFKRNGADGSVISIMADRVKYTYTQSQDGDLLKIEEQGGSPFIAINMGVVLLSCDNLKLIGKSEGDSATTCIIEGNLGLSNSFFPGGYTIKVWIDTERWVVPKTEFKLKKISESVRAAVGDIITTYTVKKFELIDDKFYFPLEIEKSLPMGKGKMSYKYKGTLINTGVSDQEFTIEVPKKTKIEMGSIKMHSATKRGLSPKYISR